MKYGTYSTFDCPTAREDEAFVWLQEQFGEIKGRVRRVKNPHDLGSYPSFEIDYPEGLDLEDDTNVLKDEWHDSANKIFQDYSTKFGDVL